MSGVLCLSLCVKLNRSSPTPSFRKPFVSFGGICCMKVARSVNQARRLVASLRNSGKTVGFVPTMGYLHEGHLSLVRLAKKENDAVVVSIFVNPLQFGPKEDYRRYPRDWARDRRLLKKVRADLIFVPVVRHFYPPGFQRR